jgi:site-specific DNA-methyltransferase (adenine-specific)
MKLTDKIQITNEDNMLLMARYPDNYFDLAIVDPPYMEDNNSLKSLGKERTQFDVSTFIPPKEKYFNELKRVSKNQIIWGGNYFTDLLQVSRGWICWDKIQALDKFSDFELAYTSFDKVCNTFRFCNNGGFIVKGIDLKIHPTQKPKELYKWLLDKYAKQGDKILDTHLGSGSIAIACHDYGFELTACELNKEYYDAAVKRINNHISQQKLF